MATKAKRARSRKRERRYSITIDREWCKSCGICAAFCPSGAVADDGGGRPEIVKSDACIGCQLCVLRCPDLAIVVEEEPEDGR